MDPGYPSYGKSGKIKPRIFQKPDLIGNYFSIFRVPEYPENTGKLYTLCENGSRNTETVCTWAMGMHIFAALTAPGGGPN